MHLILFLLFLVSLILLPYIFGTFLLSYTVTENEEHINLVSIEKIDMVRNDISPARELISRNYSIKMPILISWAKVNPDLILINESDSADNLKYIILKDENAFVVNKTSNIVNVTVSLYNDTEISYSKMVGFEDTFTNDSIFINVSLNNYLLHTIEIEELSIPIPEGYTLEKDDFAKTQRFANNQGGIHGGYLVEDKTLFMTNVRLEKKASGIIMLKLVKMSERNL